MEQKTITVKKMNQPSISRRYLGDLAAHPDAIWMVIPAILMFLVFCVYPVINVFLLGFTEYDGMTVAKFTGLYNYVRVFKDTTWWTAVNNTFVIGLGTIALQIPLALGLAIILNSEIRGQNFYRAAIFIPNITSQAIMGMIFYFIFQTGNGIFNEILKVIGVIDFPIDWLGKSGTAKLVVVLFATWFHTGLKMIFFLAALQNIPIDVYESAAIDGTNSGQKFWYITLPMLGNMFRVIVMLSIIDALKLFDSIKTITDGGPGSATNVMSTYIYNYYFSPNFISQQGYASAVSMVATIIISIIAVIYLQSSKKFGEN